MGRIRIAIRSLFTTAGILLMLYACAIDDIPMRADVVDLATKNPVWGKSKTQQPLVGGSAGDQFGFSVALSDKYAVIGAPGDSGNTGAVYVYALQGTRWILKKTLFGENLKDRFGASVSVSGERIAVGAPHNVDLTSGYGGAYVFEHSTNWLPPAALTLTNGKLASPSDVAKDEEFGKSVAIGGDYVVVGGYGFTFAAGRAWFYYKDNVTPNSWSNDFIPTPLRIISGDAFGWSTALSSEGYAFVAAVGDGEIKNLGGQLFLFQRTSGGWIPAGTLPDPITNDLTDGAQFGSSVSANAKQLVVGAAGANSAYMFRLEGAAWNQKAKLLGSKSATSDEFGGSVSTDGTTIVTGAHFHSPGSVSHGGIVYFFDAGTYKELANFTLAAPAADDELGASVAVSGTWAIAGAPGDDGKGSVSFYHKE
jgi:hypothetical protein